jgi:hypothetical protein
MTVVHNVKVEGATEELEVVEAVLLVLAAATVVSATSGLVGTGLVVAVDDRRKGSFPTGPTERMVLAELGVSSVATVPVEVSMETMESSSLYSVAACRMAWIRTSSSATGKRSLTFEKFAKMETGTHPSLRPRSVCKYVSLARFWKEK